MLPFSAPRPGPGSSLMMRLRRFMVRRRRLLAALLCCAAAGTAVQALLPPDPGEVSLVVAAADLPAGALLTAQDLRAVPAASAAVPPGSFAAVDAVTGRRLATPLKQGSPLMQTSLVGTGLLTGAPPGTVAVSVRPADPAIVQLLSPGQLVDVVLGSPDAEQAGGAPAVLAADAPVLWTGSDGASSWPGSQESGAVVVLAALPDQAAALAASSGSGNLHLILTGG
ncbi:Flp pilus assembly protein CpaB [Arthrobacter sp. zg-Y820]|uniref:Flp pilus assembly protein CpaB n=1 Tax=unclassified Arthrobacter TaxID=235627 RepID=UPI0025405034|nr:MULTISPECIES: Flp pilus assembly protein CpaB [unclassified Arthrobacter]MCC9195861.1 Flp pilus assembly protein CpaB [Arthrobacter sp. zg-Y820]MDK1278721.1 Flp pilus assembly protein CpaB [Arthrobacter sp. zg.Y820]WIB08854.1 Flp pilus assembly protein CpaB [Arthrobacter sp. zg-Y820]